jgi:hypothetical protein
MWEGGGHHERCQDISQELCFQQALFSCFTGGIAPRLRICENPRKGLLEKLGLKTMDELIINFLQSRPPPKKY